MTSNLYEQAADIVWHSVNGTLEDQFGESIRRAFINALEMPSGKDYHRVIEAIVAVLEWYEAQGLPRRASLLSTPYDSSYDMDERLRLAAEVVEAQTDYLDQERCWHFCRAG